jgi:citrate lyase beta subunit
MARSQVLLAARAARVAAYDSPHFRIDDMEGLRRRSQAARNLGYDGKSVIHPSHIDIVNEIFVPTAEQVEEARRVVSAIEAAEAEGRGVAILDGRMIDQVHLAAARKLLEQAQANLKSQISNLKT